MTDDKGKTTVSIETSSGMRKVDAERIIEFPDGLPGFREFTRYVVFDIEGCAPFKSLLSVDKNGPDFVVVESGSVTKDYNPLQYIESPDVLDLGDPLELVSLSIVTVEEDFHASTVNLRGPIIYNIAASRARQVILSDDRFSTKTPILQA